MLLRACYAGARSILPHVAIIASIIAATTATGQPMPWLTLPVICNAVPRARSTATTQAHQLLANYLDHNGYAHIIAAEAIVAGRRKKEMELLDAFRREANDMSIPLTPELEQFLDGIRHRSDVPAEDVQAISPAMEAVTRRRAFQQLYGISGELPPTDQDTC